MAITITLPDTLALRLQTEAQARNRPAEDFAVELLDRALAPEANEGEYVPMTLDEIVAKIRSAPPNPANQFDMEARMKGLEEYLKKSLAAEAEDDQEFDLDAWNREWDAVENEMKAVARANDIAEGRV
jgi:hypothetical protein